MKEVGRDSHSVDLRSLICLKERVKRNNIDSERKSKISRDTLRSKRREGASDSCCSRVWTWCLDITENVKHGVLLLK